MVAGTASRLAMETDDGLLWPLARAAAEEAAWRQARSAGSSDASYEVRRRSAGGPSHTAAAAAAAAGLSRALAADVESGALLAAGCIVGGGCCCCGGGCFSTAAVGSAGAASGVPLGAPLSVELLFWRWTRLPGAARPLSFRLSCWDAAFFLPLATIEGGARASEASPRVDSTAAQDEPVWKRGAAGRGWENGRAGRVRVCCACVVRETARRRANENGNPDALSLAPSVDVCVKLNQTTGLLRPG